MRLNDWVLGGLLLLSMTGLLAAQTGWQYAAAIGVGWFCCAVVVENLRRS